MHRVLDLAILILQTNAYMRDSYRYPKLYNPENPQIARVGLQGDAMTVDVCTDNPLIDEDIALFADALSRDGELLGERFATLGRLLAEMGYVHTA